jgi:hypothetical protein
MSSNGNSTLKVVGIISGIIVSCIAIFTFITGVASFNLLKQRDKPTTESPTEQQNAAPNTNNPVIVSTPENTPTPFGIYNPTGTIEAGQPIIVDNYQLYLDGNSFELNNEWGTPYILVKLAIKNLSNNSRIFRYTASSVIIKDDTGKIYDYLEGQQCDSASPYIETKALQIQPGESIEIGSYWSYPSAWWWCLKGSPEILPWYEGDISANAQYIIFEFNGFGPFSGFEVRIPIG